MTTVALGSSVTDQATVTGSGAGTPTGTVTFTFFANGGCTGTGTAGSPETLTAGVANSASVGPLDAAGPYSFQATYNGDSNYVTSTGACEPFAVGPGSTVTVTTVQQGGSTVTSVALGTSVTDQAMVSGSGAGTPTGTVTFTFFTNDSCTGTGTVGTAEALTSGVANSSSEGPLLAGSYSFQATYSGDANYLTSTGGCEPFTVSLAPSVVVTTVQQGGTNTTSVPAGASVTDQATVSGSGAGTPTGMVTFTSFANGTCAGTGTPAGTGTLASGVANSNTVGPLTVGGSYSFQATYNGDANYLPQTGSCEPFTVVPPVLTITKTADAASVPAGNAIGFTVVVSNGSPGTATSVTVNDPLPAGSGISWSITPAYSGPGSCSITGSAPTQVLTCALGDMAPGASASVHIQSATTAASVGTYKNTATASATNAPSVSATASIMVTVPIIPHTSLTEKASVTIENNEIPVTFTYSETNTGTVGITGVAVTGSLCGPATFVSSSNNDAAVLDPGATWIYTCTYTPDNKTAKVEKFVDMATATGTSVVTGLPAPLETAKATVKVRPGPGPCGIAVAVSPNPLVETGQSEVHAVVQVEACAAFAGDLVMISSPQLAASCAAGIAFSTLQPGTAHHQLDPGRAGRRRQRHREPRRHQLCPGAERHRGQPRRTPVSHGRDHPDRPAPANHDGRRGRLSGQRGGDGRHHGQRAFRRLRRVLRGNQPGLCRADGRDRLTGAPRPLPGRGHLDVEHGNDRLARRHGHGDPGQRRQRRVHLQGVVVRLRDVHGHRRRPGRYPYDLSVHVHHRSPRSHPVVVGEDPRIRSGSRGIVKFWLD